MIRAWFQNSESQISRTISTFPALGLILLLGAVPDVSQAGVGSVRLSWTGCESTTTNQNWDGPKQVQLIASIADASTQNEGHHVRVRILPGDGAFPEAWRFDPLGCNANQMSISYDALDEQCMAFRGANPLALAQQTYWSETNTSLIFVVTSYDLFVPDPERRYVLWTANFDLANSGSGLPGSDSECGGADQPLCFAIESAELLLPAPAWTPLIVENGFVTWQDPQNSLGCPGSVQAASRTWGRLKALFR